MKFYAEVAASLVHSCEDEHHSLCSACEYLGRCPACGTAEAWHGVIVEPGEQEQWACDECGEVR